MGWEVWAALWGVGIGGFVLGWTAAFQGRADTAEDRNREMDVHAPGSLEAMRQRNPIELSPAERDRAWVIGSRDVVCSVPEPVMAGILRVQVGDRFADAPICYVDHDGRPWFGKSDADGWVTLKRDRLKIRDPGPTPEGMRLQGLTYDPKGPGTAYFVERDDWISKYGPDLGPTHDVSDGDD